MGEIHTCLDCGEVLTGPRIIARENNKVKNQYLCPKGCVPKEIWEEA
jgi:hypothetical protein